MKLCIAPLFSGSGGNSTLVFSEKTRVLIDAGLTGKRIVTALDESGIHPGSIDAIIITHEHIDHIKGVGVLSRKYDIPVYANSETWAEMYAKIGDVAERNIRIIDESDFYINDLCIEPFSISHDAAKPFGYSVYASDAKVTVMTDTGRVSKATLARADGAKIVLLESNHDVNMLKNGSYPRALKDRILSGKGHLSNVDAAAAAAEMVKNGVRGILLGHLSRENNTEQKAFLTVTDELNKKGICVGRDVALKVTNKDNVTGIFEVK